MGDIDPRCCNPHVDPKSSWHQEKLYANKYKEFHDFNEAEAFYLEYLKRHDEEYEDKTKWLNG